MELIGAEKLTERYNNIANPWYGAYVKFDHAPDREEENKAIKEIGADIVRKLVEDGRVRLIKKEPCRPEDSPIGWSQDFWSIGIRFAVCGKDNVRCFLNEDGET